MSGTNVANNSSDTVMVTLVSADGVTTLGTYSGISSGQIFNLGSFYRNAFLVVQGGSGPRVCTQAVYLSDRAFVSIEGSAAAGYTCREADQGNYEQMFFAGFAGPALLFLCVFLIRVVRRSMNP